MILASASREASRLALLQTPLIGVELEQLVSALTNLALFAEHEAASKGIDLAAICAGSVALTTLHRLGARVGNALPHHLVAVDLTADNFSAGLIVKTAHEVHAIPDCGERGALARCRSV